MVYLNDIQDFETAAQELFKQQPLRTFCWIKAKSFFPGRRPSFCWFLSRCSPLCRGSHDSESSLWSVFGLPHFDMRFFNHHRCFKVSRNPSPWPLKRWNFAGEKSPKNDEQAFRLGELFLHQDALFGEVPAQGRKGAVFLKGKMCLDVVGWWRGCLPSYEAFRECQEMPMLSIESKHDSWPCARLCWKWPMTEYAWSLIPENNWVGGFKYFDFHRDPWGRFLFWLIFFKWAALVQPPTRQEWDHSLHLCR